MSEENEAYETGFAEGLTAGENMDQCDIDVRRQAFRLAVSGIETNEAHKNMAKAQVSQMQFSRNYMKLVGALFVVQTILACAALYRFW